VYLLVSHYYIYNNHRWFAGPSVRPLPSTDAGVALRGGADRPGDSGVGGFTLGSLGGREGGWVGEREGGREGGREGERDSERQRVY
jgi:hypothetical protein